MSALEKLHRELKPDWMSRDVTLLLTARATMSIGRALAGVILPVYLATIGFNGAHIGLLFGIMSVASAGIAVAVGLLADRYSRKLFVVAIPLVTAVSALVVGLTHATLLIYLFCVLGTLGQGSGAGVSSVGPYTPAEQALVTDVTPAAHRNSLFGRLAFFAALGALIGSPLAVMADLAIRLGFHGADAYRPAFLVVAAFSLLTGCLAIPVANPRIPPRHAKNPFAWPRRSWPFLWRFWIVIGVNGIATGFYSPFVTFWFHQRFHASAGQIGLLYTIINVITMASNLSAAGIARRLGLVRAIGSFWVVQACFMIPMALSPSFWMAGAFYLCRQIAQRVQMPLRQSYVMGMVPPEERGAVAGLSQVPAQLVSGLVPVPAGYVFDHISMALPTEIAAGVQFVVSALFLTLFRGRTPPEEAVPISTDDSPRVPSATDAGRGRVGS
jgi:MFS family permease